MEDLIHSLSLDNDDVDKDDINENPSWMIRLTELIRKLAHAMANGDEMCLSQQ